MLDLVTHICNPSTWICTFKVILGWIHSKFKVSLNYMRPYLKKPKPSRQAGRKGNLVYTSPIPGRLRKKELTVQVQPGLPGLERYCHLIKTKTTNKQNEYCFEFSIFQDPSEPLKFLFQILKP